MYQKTNPPKVFLRKETLLKKLKDLRVGETYIDSERNLLMVTCLGFITEHGCLRFDDSAEKYVVGLSSIGDISSCKGFIKLSNIEKDLEKEVRVVNITMTEVDNYKEKI